jgi:hypothetical protein
LLRLLGYYQQITGGETKTAGLHVPGFQHLGWLLPQHIDLVPELYFLFIALTMGQPIKLLPADSKVNPLHLFTFSKKMKMRYAM